MVRGEAPREAEARALDTYMVTVADHGMNASTFAARVVASTGSDATSALTAALGALKGPLHGGAPGPVLDMLDAIGEGDPEPWLAAELSAGRRIMGMGHRIYRVRDPRAAALEGALARLGTGGTDRRTRRARRVEEAAERLLAARHPGRNLKANVEFYTALLLEALGLPRAAFTAVFAAARVAGWLAHVAEQTREGRLIRPGVEYVGPVRSRRAEPAPVP
jgi:citrate synthase